MKTALLYSPKLKNYSFGQGHPFTSERFKKFLDFLKKEVLDFKKYFEEITPTPASESDLKLFHSEEYIRIMTKASKGIVLPNIFKYTTADNLNPQTGYLPKGIEEAARIAVGTSVLAASLVLKGKFKKAVSLGGGLHHAKKEKGEGFCVYNDVAICGKKLLEEGAKKILILDTDAHAGNGTAEAFYEDERVLFIDLHQDPRTVYPGTGFLNDIGEGEGEGFTVNVPFPLESSDEAYRYVFKEIIFPLANEFKPEIIIRNGGSDPYFNDGLTNLGLTLKGFKIIGENVRQLSEKVCKEKEVDLIASGYNREILPSAWTALLSGLINLDIKIKDPQEKLAPPQNSKLGETKDLVIQLKDYLKKYWKCFK